MSTTKRPLSLRHGTTTSAPSHSRFERSSVSAVAIACITASSVSAIAQTAGTEAAPAQQGQTQLPKLTVETTVKKKKKKTYEKPKVVTKKPAPAPVVAPAQPEPQPSAEDIAAAAAAPGPATPGGNPYADPQAPYKVDSSANAKLTEPIVDTPRTVTTVPKEVLQDKQATSIRELTRTTPGISLGFGEGGSVFGDNLFIRGFNANNDAYIDGVRDSGTTSRETFMTEQVEILKGPSSSVGGRGTTGGALNIVTKKPQEENFAIGALTLGTDSTVRTTLDVNYAIDPTFAVRMNGMWQEADVAGRDGVFDDRWGGAISAQWKPTHWFKLVADYYHINLDQMSDWGVPYANTVNGVEYNAPWPEFGVSRDNWYGIAARDFQKGEQDIGTLTNEIKFSPDIKLTNKLRKSRTFSDYIVSAPSGTDTSDPDPANWTVGASVKSNHQYNDILAWQSDLQSEFRTGRLKHTLVFGFELSREEVARQGYQNLDTESFQTTGITSCTFNLWSPSSTDTTSCWGPNDVAVLSGNVTDTTIDTRSAYILDTIKISEQLRISGGVRIDDYAVSRSTSTADLVQPPQSRPLICGFSSMVSGTGGRIPSA